MSHEQLTRHFPVPQHLFVEEVTPGTRSLVPTRGNVRQSRKTLQILTEILRTTGAVICHSCRGCRDESYARVACTTG